MAMKGSYPCAEMQSVYSTVPADLAVCDLMFLREPVNMFKIFPKFKFNTSEILKT